MDIDWEHLDLEAMFQGQAEAFKRTAALQPPKVPVSEADRRKANDEEIARSQARALWFSKQMAASREKFVKMLVTQHPRFKIGDRVLVKRGLVNHDTIRPGDPPIPKRYILEPGFVISVGLVNTVQGPMFLYGLTKMLVDGTPSKVPMGSGTEHGLWGDHAEKMIAPYDAKRAGRISKR